MYVKYIHAGHATPELNCMGHTPYTHSPNFVSPKVHSLADNSPNFPTTKVSLHTVSGMGWGAE